MPEAAGSWVMVATVPSARQAGEVAYGLKLRSIEARVVKIAGRLLRGGGVGVEVKAEDEGRARDALGFIIEGMKEPAAVGVAMTGCPFCGYDLTGLPWNAPCPECGKDLSSEEAARRARELGA